MIYIYVDTRNYDLKKIDEALEKAKNLKLENFRFLVNDIRSIDYLRQKGYKAINLDGFPDVFNIVTHDDELYYQTDEDDEFVKIQYPNSKKI
jgi:phosphatidylserine/phosphatidylglycerophosphate/cardiolipin synthase-like enzyme